MTILAGRYLLDVDEYGLLLHTCNDHVFWSRVNPHGFNSAATFRNEAEVHLWLRSRFRDVEPDEFPKWRLIPVVADMGAFASVGECVKAGALLWDVKTEGSC
jgi:hypothetical protein